MGYWSYTIGRRPDPCGWRANHPLWTPTSRRWHRKLSELIGCRAATKKPNGASICAGRRNLVSARICDGMERYPGRQCLTTTPALTSWSRSRPMIRCRTACWRRWRAESRLSWATFRRSREWVEDGVNGFLSPTRDPNPLADKIVRAFEATAQVISKFAAQTLTGSRWRRMRRGN